MFSTSSSPTANDATTTLYSVLPAVTGINGDSGTTYYVIPASGDRTFNVVGHIGKKTNASTSQVLSVTAVNYGATAGTYTSTVTAGLGNLVKSSSFSSGLD